MDGGGAIHLVERSGMNERTDSDGRRLAWGVITVAGLIALGYGGWLGVAVTNLQQQMAALTVKIDIALQADRLARTRQP